MLIDCHFTTKMVVPIAPKMMAEALGGTPCSPLSLCLCCRQERLPKVPGALGWLQSPRHPLSAAAEGASLSLGGHLGREEGHFHLPAVSLPSSDQEQVFSQVPLAAERGARVARESPWPPLLRVAPSAAAKG